MTTARTQDRRTDERPVKPGWHGTARATMGVGLFLGVALLAAACGGSTAGEDSTTGAPALAAERGGNPYFNMTPDELATAIEQDGATVVNVHIPYAGEIPGTDLFVPYDQVEQQVGQFPADPQARIIVYCRSGGMSVIAAQTLADLGYANVWNVEGGMAEWERSGRPLTRTP